MAPLISVVVPVYNVEQVLHYCVESILKQTYRNFELLLIDDGSPDKSGEICDGYAEKDERVKVIHKENQGVSSARNTGFDKAKGEYIVCVDSDDYVDECYLQDFMDVIAECPDAEMVWCCFSAVKDYDKNIIQNVRYDESGKLIKTDISKIMTLHEKWLDASPWTKLYSKKIIKSNGLHMNESMSLGEDLLFNFEYMNRCKNKNIYITNKCAYYYVRSEKESLDNKFRPDLFDVYKHINDELLKFITSWNVDSEQLSLFYNSAYFSYEKCMRNTFHNNNTASKKEKYAVNKEIMRSDRFIESVKKSNCKIVLPIRIAYKFKNYILVETINNFIRFLYEKKKQI